MVVLSIYAGKTKTGKQLGGPALLVILFTAVIANFNLIPSASNSIELYDIIFKYVAPISIFFLLLKVNITTIKNAGLPMVGLFIIGSLATTCGIILSWYLLNPESLLGEDGKIIAGMLTGTYTGGSVNFNAIALEYEFQKKGVLYAGTIAVDNVVTAIWIMITLILPTFLNRIWKSNKKFISNRIQPNKKTENERISINSLSWLLFLGISAYYVSDIFTSYVIDIPSILILTTIGIVMAQSKFISNIKGSQELGLYLVYIFLAVIGAYCEIGAVSQLQEIGLLLLIFTICSVLIHGILFIIIGGIIYRDWEMISIASQANIGGGASAIALAEAFDRKDLILPSILVGSLGNALGTYLGFFVVYIL
ncbi:MAG: DUF819 family protein [Flavobacteriales bacterium]|nr:MAG: DUF819 family protein [Flavobacteriales bacterium]|tara:strand:+ start:1893 stop:2987 length:1095 start_codon:yes stop_codon:yes gene_type:complete